MSKILISGGTGLIGEILHEKLVENNHEVRILSRNPTKSNEYKWNIKEKYIDEKVFTDLDFIIHLAGAGIANKCWTNKRKQEIIDSRVQSTNLLFKKITELKTPLKGFISASGIGYYGAMTSDTIFKEDDKPENDFISNVCVLWENAVKKYNQINIPTTILRTGIVLTKNGGALSKMNTPIFLSSLGNGKQYMPWIHIDDLCNLYIKAIEDNTFTGIYNAVAPEHQTNLSFTRTLGTVLSKTILLIKIPSFVLKTVFGELAKILLYGSRVSSKKITKTGFEFEFKTLNKALTNLLSK
ncbi:hypothetical protein OD91_2406 [Lutibacter sp. Hel_I_33_5]|uniref:TIGR01777 family oxidoreductase n=1 Tax=Lutibacter sp. Hel_I_33_5 TaxID=1566289 RepID=UPI00119D7508|nr:TIGR01777 family oxidoreductase [Lutibacter sp. Hel_I_33_5]TVZ57100.1 hypothetical protein OD91_2406 [Lutibacter sp. Hel_I_33_5]